MFDLLIQNAQVLDGTGAPGFTADVAVKDGKIATVGKISGEAAETIDAAGLTLAPGDVLVFGACAAEISEEYTEDELIRGHGAVIVQSVADNTLRPRLRSWKVVCV